MFRPLLVLRVNGTTTINYNNLGEQASDREQLVGYRLIGSEDHPGSVPHDHPMAMPELMTNAIPRSAMASRRRTAAL